jgi:7-cyano-7-deazaguanine synthase
MKRAKKAVVLLSGGLDSAVTLYDARRRGYRCFCLIFDYGQRHRREIESAKKVASAAHSPFEVLKINLAWKGSALLDMKVKVPSVAPGANRNCAGAPLSAGIPSTYVPGRNIIFLSFALSYAEAIGAEAIFIGAHAQDYSGYPDCRPQFIRAFSRVIATGTKAGVEKKKIRVLTPLIHKTKAGIIRLGVKLKVPFNVTWSCYRGGKTPCGECDSCYYRAKGFKEAGIQQTPGLKG